MRSGSPGKCLLLSRTWVGAESVLWRGREGYATWGRGTGDKAVQVVVDRVVDVGVHVVIRPGAWEMGC